MGRIREELEYTTRFLKEENRKGKKLTSELPIIVGGAAAALIGGILAYKFLGKRDEEAPQIDKLDFRERVERGQSQSILVCAKEQNPSEYATLKLNGTSIELPLSERSNGGVCYSSSFDPSKYFSKEGAVSGQLILTDKFGNSVSKDISFLVNLEAPKIGDVKIDRVDLGKYKISANVEDENLKDVYVILDNNKIPLSQENGRFSGIIETLKDLNFTLFANDKFNMTSSYQGKIEFSKDNPNVAYALQKGLNQTYISLIAPLDRDKMQDLNEKKFVDLIANNSKILVIPTFSNYLGEKASDGVITDEELKYSSNFASLVNGIYDEISKFYFIKSGRKVYIDDKINVTDYASSLGLKLGFDKNLASNATARAIAYYGIAVKKDNLPEDFNAISLLTKGTQIEKYGNNLADFEPIVIKDAKGNTIVIESYDRARDTWMIAYLLKQRPELVEQPKKFEWVNRMIQQVAWNIFDDKYGLNSGWIEPTTGKRHLPENLTPTNEKVWNIILGFHEYMDKLPSQMKKDDLPRFFHYEDSDLLQKEISDKTNRTIALFYLAALPSVAYNRENYNYEIGSDGMLLFVKRLPQMYDVLANSWKNLDKPWNNPDPKNYKTPMDIGYKMWLQDRYIHGLENTVRQFSGEWPFEQEGTIDDFLNKNFFAWKFAKFPYAYLRGMDPQANEMPNYGEWEMYGYELPLAYKAVSIPVGSVNIIEGQIGGDGTSGNLGGPGNYSVREFTIYGIPQSVIDALLAQKSVGRVAIGYGNGVSLMSAIDGFEKDSGYEIWQYFRRTEICLWKK